VKGEEKKKEGGRKKKKRGGGHLGCRVRTKCLLLVWLERVCGGRKKRKGEEGRKGERRKKNDKKRVVNSTSFLSPPIGKSSVRWEKIGEGGKEKRKGKGGEKKSEWGPAGPTLAVPSHFFWI